jgi:short-subunit dehydrogenase
MAKYGFNLVLVSRTPEKLERVRDECKRVNSNVVVETVAMDFSKAGIEDFKNAFNGF